MPQRAWITGITGFAGGFLAEHLLEAGDAVIGSAPAGRWDPASPASIRDAVELVPWDLGSEERPGDEALRWLEGFAPEVVYHLAGLSIPADCGEKEPTAAARAVNVEGTRRVLALAGWLPSRPRVLLTSSSRVYAPVPPHAPRVAEDAPLGAVRGYGKTKLAAEALSRQAAACGCCEVVIARAFQHAGPRQAPRLMLSEWAWQFATRPPTDPIEVQSLDARIDLSDVRDVVRAYRLLMLHGDSGEVYNVGSGRNLASGEVFRLLEAAAGQRRRAVERCPGHKQDPIADVTRLRAATGWTPQLPLAQTVADTFAYWHSAADSWSKDVDHETTETGLGEKRR